MPAVVTKMYRSVEKRGNKHHC